MLTDRMVDLSLSDHAPVSATPSPSSSSFSSPSSNSQVAPSSSSSSSSILLAAVASAFPTSSLLTDFPPLCEREIEGKEDTNHTTSSYLYPTSTLCDAFINNRYGGQKNLREEDLKFIRTIFSRTQMNTSCISLPLSRCFTRLHRQEYTKHIKYALKSMAVSAAEKAIYEFNEKYLTSSSSPMSDSVTASDIRPLITHIVFGTMTASIHAPSMDVELVNALSLSRSTKRLNVESMGCLTGFRLVGMAGDICQSSPNAVVLLIVADIRSALGNLLAEPEKAENGLTKLKRLDVIVSALFRDGGGAAIFCNENRFRSTHKLNRSLSYVEHVSHLIPDSNDYAYLHESDDGSQELYLDKRIPICVREYLPSIVVPLLETHHIQLSNCFFAVHTGGPRVLDAVRDSLSLTPQQLIASWYVMLHYGNLSGSSNLVVTDHLLSILSGKINKENTMSHERLVFPSPSELQSYTHAIGISFGPGIGLELVLFKLTNGVAEPVSI